MQVSAKIKIYFSNKIHRNSYTMSHKAILIFFFILGVRKSKVTQFLKESTGRDGFSRVGAAKILEVRSASLSRDVPKRYLQRNADSDIGDAAQINA